MNEDLLEQYLKRLELVTARAIVTRDSIYRDKTADDVVRAMYNGDVNGLCIALREFDDMVFESDDPLRMRYHDPIKGKGIAFDTAWAEARLAQESK